MSIEWSSDNPLWNDLFSNSWPLFTYEIWFIVLFWICFRVRVSTLVKIFLMTHLSLMATLSFLMGLFDLDGTFTNCVISHWSVYQCVVAASRREWVEPIWVGMMYMITIGLVYLSR